MVARTPPKEKVLMVAPRSLDATQIRQTLKKVDQCMARLQELQHTVNGGKKVVCGVSLSPRSTRAYLKTSLRCKQESIRMKTSSSNNVNGSRKSPVGKLPSPSDGGTGGEWRRMSLPAMLVGETVGEILQASKFAREFTETMNKLSSINNNFISEDPKTPVTLHKKQRDPRTPVSLHQKQRENERNPENNPSLESRRKREKQHKFRVIQPQSNNNDRDNNTSPSCRRRALSRINFKVSPPKKTQQQGKESRTSTILNAQGINHQSTTASTSGRYSANRVSPKHKPWAKKTVLFPNPLFHSTSPTSSSQQQNHKMFCNKTNSPIIGKKTKQQIQQTPHKFLIKSPPQRVNVSKSPPRKGRVSSSSTKFQVKIKTPPKISPPRPKFAAVAERGRLAERERNPSPSSKILSTASRLRRSLSPARLANRLVSPLRSRKANVQKSTQGGDDDEFMAGMKRRNSFMSMRFSAPRIVV